MNIGRRTLLKFAGGAAVGAMATPVPWKLMSDSALWSQNWSWIPRVPRGDESVKYTSCTLCPAGCGVQARCIGAQPVSLKGAAGHPLSNGTLCALGIAAHHLPYHPRRASRPLKMNANGRHEPVALEVAITEINDLIQNRAPGENIVILDERPGRTLSYAYRRFLAAVSGIYATPPARETATLEAAAAISGMPRLGFDLKNTRAAISFGAPILDGWGVPAEVYAARYRADSPLKIIQVESKQSRTASLADLWLPARPGTETAIALGIAHELAAKGLAPTAALDLGAYTPAAVSAISGIPAETITAAADMLTANRPAVAIGGGDPGGGPAASADESIIAALNVLLGSIGVAGGLLPREEPPVPAEWAAAKMVGESRLAEVPDHSIAVLILGDAPSGDAIPWPLIRRKLTAAAKVVSLAPFAEGPSRRAHYIVPSPAFLEQAEELPTPPASHSPSYAIAPQLIPPPSGAVPTLAFLSKLGGPDSDLNELLKRRIAALQSARRGQVFDLSGTKPIGEFAKPEDFEAAMLAGATWTADALPPKAPVHVAMPAFKPPPAIANNGEYPLTLMPYAWRGASGSAALPPLLTKVYQESLLRASSFQCRIHPATAGDLGIAEGERVTIETRCGSCEQSVWVDASVMPGVVEVPAGPQSGGEANILDVCDAEQSGIWRTTSARVRRLA